VYNDASEGEPLLRPMWTESRASERIAFPLPSSIYEVNGQIRHGISIENIGEIGLLFGSDWKYQKYDRITLDVPLPEGHYRMDAIVTRCQIAAFGQWSYFVGAQFHEPPSEFQDCIYAHIRRLSRRRRSSIVMSDIPFTP
jgi:hypothetical protein